MLCACIWTLPVHFCMERDEYNIRDRLAGTVKQALMGYNY